MVKYAKVEEFIEIPDDVDLELEGKKITVKGKKGTVVKDFSHARSIEIAKEGNKLKLLAYFPRRNVIALIYTIKNLINNMFLGVQKGYTYKMKIVYSHFPITLEPPKNNEKEIKIKNFIGERAPRITYVVGDDVVVKATKEEVIVTGCDKEHVGQTAANIQKRCHIKKKDKRVFQDGIYVYEKLVGDEVFWTLK